mmetsp:Transcript_34307/g.94772  ORF Transcript_34307/g.94772 Transcript_34307/m.94772 type:complete len:207 (-) Transcript_34307:349-969(-)
MTIDLARWVIAQVERCRRVHGPMPRLRLVHDQGPANPMLTPVRRRSGKDCEVHAACELHVFGRPAMATPRPCRLRAAEKHAGSSEPRCRIDAASLPQRQVTSRAADPVRTVAGQPCVGIGTTVWRGPAMSQWGRSRVQMPGMRLSPQHHRIRIPSAATLRKSNEARITMGSTHGLQRPSEVCQTGKTEALVDTGLRPKIDDRVIAC